MSILTKKDILRYINKKRILNGGFWSYNCAEQLLCDIVKHHGVILERKGVNTPTPTVKMHAHNLEYDWRFINKYIDNPKKITRGVV